MMKPTLIGIGEILWDIFPSSDNSSLPVRRLGGAPANFAYHANALGGTGIAVSCIGSDTPGEDIITHLRSLSLTDTYITKNSQYPTGTVVVDIDDFGNPLFTIQENVAWDFIPEYPELMQLAGKCDAVCYGTLAQRSETSRSTIRNFLSNTHANTLRVFDINLRQKYYSREIIEESLDSADVLKINNNELSTITDLLTITGEEPLILRQLSERYGLQLIALTKGDKGSVLYANGSMSVHQGFKTEVCDTVGAGDSFTATLALGILRGYTLDTINEHANRVASFVCSCPGATPRIPQELIVRE